MIDVGGALTLGSESDFRISPAHFAERYALIVIIALGESIVAIGVGAAEEPRDATFALAVTIAFAGVAALWWSYFDFFALGAERALRFAEPRRRGPLLETCSRCCTTRWCSGSSSSRSPRRRRSLIPRSGSPERGEPRWRSVSRSGSRRPRSRATASCEGSPGSEGLAIAAAPLAVVLLPGLAAMWLVALVIGIVVALLAVEAARLSGVRAQIRSDGPPVEGRPKRT